MNDHYTFLMLQVILADEMADLCFLGLPSGDQEWQLHISTVIRHIGR